MSSRLTVEAMYTSNLPRLGAKFIDDNFVEDQSHSTALAPPASTLSPSILAHLKTPDITGGVAPMAQFRSSVPRPRVNGSNSRSYPNG